LRSNQASNQTNLVQKQTKSIHQKDPCLIETKLLVFREEKKHCFWSLLIVEVCRLWLSSCHSWACPEQMLPFLASRRLPPDDRATASPSPIGDPFVSDIRRKRKELASLDHLLATKKSELEVRFSVINHSHQKQSQT
jgi:hypothetical protein